MSPGSPGGAKGPRRISWDRLPGPDGLGAPPPSDPESPRLPRGPVAGAPAAGPAADGLPIDVTQPIRRTEGPTGPKDRVAAERERATGAHDRVRPLDGTAAHDRTGGGRLPLAEPRQGDKEAESRLSQPHKRQYLSLWIELPLLLVVAFSAAVLLRTFAVQPFYIPSGSMEQTLQEGDKVLVLKLTTTLRTPQRGEVVVFRGTDSWDPEYRPAGGEEGLLDDVTTAVLDLIGLARPDEKDFIKRVIAVGGDTVACCDEGGNVVVNGVSLDESEYVYDDAPLDVDPGTCHSRRFDEVAIPEGEVWVMGDHRGDSKDSRCQGPVPVENLIGRAIALVWPTDRARELEIPDAFDVLDGTGGTSGEEGDRSAVGDGLPAAWGTFWHQPPALPATAMPAPTAARRPSLRSERERVDSHRDRRRAIARRRR
ncbi:signal peptidase I [Glycomyces sp. TRM65418]|uniref:signal peptidase I n=1 Tax=Glycomyces sp. TRM65418 TaxID=2867006 RepID=UPI001CE671A7|nr:signal peptidase I [Glycomyces sp. TRM65418]MCC3762407.1 signal peptidase I [Glycomyces sp. TRM65418]QZD56452.1 signal peptidase I [Glycomyces sp. TRM65418]